MGSGDHRLMSKTQHYRKVTKPLLERKRRARMNFYLDALKDLIVDTMEAQGDHVTKLEKADILEMTVQYLKTKKNIINSQIEIPLLDPKKFEAGYSQAAYEVSKVFASFPGLDLRFGTKLMKHLGYQLKDINKNPNMLSSQSKCHLEFEDLQEENDKPKDREVWRPW